MIIGDKFVFIHAPKCAGMSLTRYFLNDARGAMKIFVPAGAIDHGRAMIEEEDALDRVCWHEGLRHETFEQAEIRCQEMGGLLSDKAMILVVAREPAALLRSYYFHLKKPATINLRTQNGALPAKGELKLAIEENFETFVENGSFYGYQPRASAKFFKSETEAVQKKTLVIPIEKLSQFVGAMISSGLCFGRTEMPFRNVSAYDRNIVEADCVSEKINAKFEDIHSIWNQSLSDFDDTLEKLKRAACS